METAGKSEDEMMEIAIESGAEDVQIDEELVGQPAAEAGVGADAELQDRGVAALEAAHPEEGRALRLEAAGVGHDADHPLPRLPPVEGIGPEVGREALVVLLDRARHPQQRLVPAIRLHAVPAARADGDARLGEVPVLAGEGLALVRREPLQLLHRPGLLAPVHHPLARPGGELRALGAPARHPAGSRAAQVLEVRLSAEAAHDPRGAQRQPGLGPGEVRCHAFADSGPGIKGCVY